VCGRIPDIINERLKICCGMIRRFRHEALSVKEPSGFDGCNCHDCLKVKVMKYSNSMSPFETIQTLD
jgi:hypothetical protein